MKKIISIILTLALAASLALTASAFRNNIGNHEIGGEYDIPKAQTAPVIDGEFTTDDEWADALCRELNKFNVTDGVHGFHTSFEGANFYYMWNEAGFYLFAEVNDSTFPMLQADYSYMINGGSEWILSEGVHLLMYADWAVQTQERESVLHWSFIPFTTEEEPAISERMTLADNAYAFDPEGCEIASCYTDTGYAIEAFIPSVLFLETSPEIIIAEGTVIPMTAFVFNRAPGPSDYSYRDSTWYDAVDANQYTLVSEPAGAEPASTDETDAATEAPTDAPATEAPTEAPATEAPTDAPATEEPTEAPTEAPTEEPTEEPTEAPTEPVEELPTDPAEEEPTEEATEAPAEPADDEEKSNTGLIIGIAVAAVAVIGAGVGVVVAKKKKA